MRSAAEGVLNRRHVTARVTFRVHRAAGRGAIVAAKKFIGDTEARIVRTTFEVLGY